MKLPRATLAPGRMLWRIHRQAHPALHFSRHAGRFDSPDGSFGVLYAALDFACAFAETLVRNPARRLVGWPDIAARAVTQFRLAEALPLVDLRGAGLSRLGLDATVLAGPYAVCGALAQVWHDDASAPAGIIWRSRFDPSLACVAVFERAAAALVPAGPAMSLQRMEHQVAEVLDRYGKALAPD